MRLRPLLLVAVAAVVVAGGLFLLTRSTSNAPSGSKGAATGGGSGTHTVSHEVPFSLTATNPAPGAQNVPPNTTISVTFSKPVSLHKTALVLKPAVAGSWVQTSPTTLSYSLDSPLIPSSQEVLTIPGGSGGVRDTTGATLAATQTVTFGVAAGDTLRLQQLLAQLNFLPLAFTPTGPAPAKADLATDQAGAFAWRWPAMPDVLTSQWTRAHRT